MKTTFVKVIAQKAGGSNGKTILVAVVPDEFLGEGNSDIMEFQAMLPPPTIYTGTYPTLRIMPETGIDRMEDLRGMGIAGIITGESWYNQDQEESDVMGIGL